MSFLALLFSPSGVVGRVTWWVTYIITLSLAMILMGIFFQYLGKAHLLTPPPHGATATVDLHQPQAAFSDLPVEDQRALIAIGLAFPVLLWINFVIEIKRWHDLGMSGWCVLLRFVPSLVHVFLPVLPHAVFGFGSGLWSLVLLGYLGFKAGESAESSDRASWPGVAMLFLVAIPMLAAASFFVFTVIMSLLPAKNGQPWTLPSIPTIPAMNTTTPSTTTPDATTEPPPVNTAHIPFAKDWVYVDEQRLTGITSVLPASGERVTIICDQGGRNVPASSLPQGFLDDWHITPGALKAMDNQ